jgi:predicted DNA-binding transcriptional regulator AlpA
MTQQDASDRIWAIEAAGYLRVSRSTLAKWRMNGMGPPFHRCGPRLVYYLKHEIDAWLAECDRQKAGSVR